MDAINKLSYTILVTAAPTTEAAFTAFQFCKSLLQTNHSIDKIFFYSDATYVASSLAIVSQDERNLTQLWDGLANEHKLDLVACVASAMRRGVIDKQTATSNEKEHYNLSQSFSLGGLGQLYTSIAATDRFIHFQ